MGKEREGKFHPTKGKPSDTSKEEEQGGLRTSGAGRPAEAVPIKRIVTLDKDTFSELAATHPAPCVSIYLNTHPAGLEVNELADRQTLKACLL